MPSTSSANAGSFERWKVRTRWGSTRWARQIRWIVRSARPTRSATARPVQCVTSQALAGAQDDARPLDVLVRAVPVSDESGEALTITGVEEDARGLGHAPRLAHLRRTVNPQIASVH